MIRRASLALLVACGPALAQEAPLAPEAAPVPQARPEAAASEEAAPDPPEGEALSEERPDPVPSEEAPGAGEAPEAPSDERPDLIPPGDAPSAQGEPLDAPPDERPDLIPPEEMPPASEEAGPDAAPTGEADPADPLGPEAEVEPPLVESPEELAACLAALDALGVGWERAEPVSDPANPGCGIASPVVVSEIAPGVLLEPASPMRCATALAAARWVADVVIPMGLKLEGRGGVVAVDQGAPFVCRPRADGEMSEHSTGSAIDVMGFRFASGEPIAVEPRAGDGTMEEAFQRAVRAGACLDFPTVLGPGSDEAHADHLHLDIKERDGGFRICE